MEKPKSTERKTLDLNVTGEGHPPRHRSTDLRDSLAVTGMRSQVGCNQPARA
jgi:hypothetical protein